MSRTWSLLSSILLIIPALVSIIAVTWHCHYSLPLPNTYLYDPITGSPTLSESAILEYARQLSEDIGYRTVGTREHALADEWMVAVANNLKELCDKTSKKLECEVWHQRGSGSHRFDMMGKRLYKTYANLTNIVFRISNGSPEGKEHAVLVNAHLDSTLPSPGAADDALAVGVMIECIRVLIETSLWEPTYSIVFLFNHAEESLQDGSQLFSTQHPVANTIRAVINLEAAGTMGPALVFQATSEAMIEAYSHVERPYGTVVANDIFSSGIVLSDTDFRQFEHYLNVSGLDMAIVGHSYFYHTRKDLVKHIEPGCAQHMADTSLQLLKYLSSHSSALPSLKDHVPQGTPSTIYFSLLGKYFFMYSAWTAKALSFSLLLASVVLSKWTNPSLNTFTVLKGVYSLTSAVVGAVLGANAIAWLMDRLLNKSLSWFSSEVAPVFLFGPAALTGALISQLLLPFDAPDEQSLLSSILLVHTFLAWFIQTAFSIGSSQIFFLSSLSQFAGLLFAHISAPTSNPRSIRLTTYIIWQVLPLIAGTECLVATLDFFVPLTGRIGEEAPAEHIIATLVALGGCFSVPATLPFFSRFSRAVTKRATSFFFAVTIIMIAIFAVRSPFDEMHPKRVYVLHTENVTVQESYLHVAAADRSPGFDALVGSIADELHGQEMTLFTKHDVAPVVMNERNGDWDSLYPFSAFLTPFRIPLKSNSLTHSPISPQSSGDDHFRIDIAREVLDLERGVRKLDLVIHHPGLIWSVIAFDALVLNWSLDDQPPSEFARHYVKEASFYGVSTYSISLEVLLPTNTSNARLAFNFIGIREDTMYPALRDSTGLGSSNPRSVLEHLDKFIERESGGTVDLMLLGCIAGVVQV